MARPGLMRHKKFARLARLIGNEVLARGHLELLWEVAYENGDDLVGDAGDLEHLAKWAGPPCQLADAMLEAGFVDLEGEQYRIHDLWDHAPDYVRKRRQRENERQEKGANLRRSATTDRTATGQRPPDGAQRPPNGRPRAPAPAPAPSQEAAAATRASARSDGTQLGSEAGTTSAPPPSVETPVSEPSSSDPGTAGPGEASPGSASDLNPGPAAPGHPAEAAASAPPTRQLRAVQADDDVPLRPLDVLDTTELDEGAAELRAKLERRAEWKFLVAAHERRAEVRRALELLVEALGIDRCEALCWAVLERRKRNGLQPPKALAFFVPMLDEAAKGGDPMPPDPPSPEFNQVQSSYDSEVEARWAPLLARLTPAAREAYEADKARLLATIRSKGLWTSAETLELREAEGWLFTKYSRRAAGEA